MRKKISIVITAHNEEKYLRQTLKNILNQKLKPAEIIVVNDNSNDRTEEIAKSFNEIKVVNFPKKHENWAYKKELALVLNFGFKQINPNYDYVMKLDSDHLLPPEYIQLLVEHMENEPNVVIASGKIEGEFSTTPRGSGRLFKKKFMDIIENQFPINFGIDSYVCFKALSLGFDIKLYDDILSTVQRKTGLMIKPSNYLIYGQSMRALGYPISTVILKSILFFKKKQIKNAIYLLFGYIINYNLRYEHEVQNYIKKKNKYSIKRFFDLIIISK